MPTRQFARRAMTTLAAVMFAASVTLTIPSLANADGTGTPPPPPPGPSGMPYITSVAYSLMYVQAVL